MANLDRQRLRRLIQLEMKTLMDEDALFMKRNIPGDYDDDALDFRNANSIDLPDEYYDTDYEDDMYPYGDEDAYFDNSPAVSYMQMRLDEGNSDCGCHSGCSGCGSSELNPYEEQRMEDFGMHMDDQDHKHKHSSYMARPQLYKIAKYATEMLDMVGENEELQDWQESKIAQISQMIGSVYHSLDYDEEYEEYDDHDDLDIHDLIGMIRTGNI